MASGKVLGHVQDVPSGKNAKVRAPLPEDASWITPETMYRGLELHFFAHLNLADDADRQLSELGFGRTHHRILYFVSRTPGITVGEMLSILRVTHQNVQRGLGELVRKGLIEQRTSMVDRRQRQLFITGEGQELFDQLTKRQFERISRAYAAAGQTAVKGFWKVLWHMIEESDREWLERGSRQDA
jgi:DNA-binding MarR family transcriptional regulator